jgi:hypothetical protein
MTTILLRLHVWMLFYLPIIVNSRDFVAVSTLKRMSLLYCQHWNRLHWKLRDDLVPAVSRFEFGS